MTDTRVHSLKQLVNKVSEDKALQELLKQDPVGVIARIAEPEPLRTDVWIYRMVVGALGLCVLAAVFGSIVLSQSADDIPDVLTALGSAAIGALAGLLAPSPNRIET